MTTSATSGADDTARPASDGSVPKEVLAFYYGWYANPTTTKVYAHWDPEPGSTTQASNITDTPADGLYSSFDPAEAARQVAEAQSAGITGFIASWWGVANNTNKSLPVLLQAADNAGMKIAAMLEPNSITGTTDAQLMVSAEQDIEYLVDTYAGNPAWLTVDGKPVIFIYGVTANELTPAEWATVLQVANAGTPNGVVAMGPNGTQWAPVFDGGFDYTIASGLNGLSPSQAGTWTASHDASQIRSELTAGQTITTSTVIPGFDNVNDASETTLIEPRDNGALYAAEWQSAVAANPDWVLVTTWNEYHEGTEIEPTVQYGTSFLTETAGYARQFLDLPPPSYAIAATDADKTEATSGTDTPFTFQATRSGDATGAATLDYSVAGSGADPAQVAAFAGGAYPSGQVDFAAGQRAATITVAVAAGQTVGGPLGFTVTLSGPSGTAIVQPGATGVIEGNITPAAAGASPPGSEGQSAASALSGSSGTAGTQAGAAASGAALPAGSVTLQGGHARYAVYALGDGTHGAVQDGLAGATDSQNLSGPTDLGFSDGVGVFDPTGNAELIARLYQAVFDRAPDLGGLNYWTGLLDSGSLDPTGAAQALTASSEFSQDYAGATSNDAFVAQVYQNVLGRPGDASGMQFWTGQLDAGASRGSVLLGFAESFENVRSTLGTAGDAAYGEAYRLYQAALDRTPDAGGLDYWVSALQAGATPQQVAGAFAASSEFLSRTGSLDNGDFVASLYNDVLGRAGDAAGQQSWTAALDAGASRAGVLLGFSDSVENRANTASATHDGWVFLQQQG